MTIFFKMKITRITFPFVFKNTTLLFEHLDKIVNDIKTREKRDDNKYLTKAQLVQTLSFCLQRNYSTNENNKKITPQATNIHLSSD